MSNRLEAEPDFREYLARAKRLTPNTQNSYVSYMNSLADGNGGHICPGCLHDELTLVRMLDQMSLTQKQHNDMRSAGRAYIACFNGVGEIRDLHRHSNDLSVGGAAPSVAQTSVSPPERITPTAGKNQETAFPAFTGTYQEFKRYIGPRLRNLVQMITKKHKATVAACEYCGASEKLEAAHIHGRDRNQIINLLMAASSPKHAVTVNLEKFEADFRREHDPVEKAILILCRNCHAKYDAGNHRVLASGVKGTGAANVPSGESTPDTLPITLEPSQLKEFRSQLLVHRTAKIATYYADGRIEERLWDSSKFTETSDVMKNLRSRPEFRQGAWQAAGVVKVHVIVMRNHA